MATLGPPIRPGTAKASSWDKWQLRGNRLERLVISFLPSKNSARSWISVNSVGDSGRRKWRKEPEGKNETRLLGSWPLPALRAGRGSRGLTSGQISLPSNWLIRVKQRARGVFRCSPGSHFHSRIPGLFLAKKELYEVGEEREGWRLYEYCIPSEVPSPPSPSRLMVHVYQSVPASLLIHTKNPLFYFFSFVVVF